MKSKVVLSLFVATGLLVSMAAANAIVDFPSIPNISMKTVVANFDNASGSGVDTFPGIAGEGWAGSWQVCDYYGNLNTTVTVEDATHELHAGNGSYLSVLAENPNAITGEIGTHSLSRCYDATSGIDLSKDHSIEFTLRIDETEFDDVFFTDMWSYEDRYEITGSDMARGEFGAADTFAIMAAGNEGAWGSEQIVRKWAFADGNKRGFINTFVGSGIDLVQGGVYDFAITLDVDAKTYDITVTDSIDTFTAEGLGWITDAETAGGWLNFITQSSNSYPYPENRAMSIDNIRISQVPEPSMVVLFLGLVFGLLVWRKK